MTVPRPVLQPSNSPVIQPESSLQTGPGCGTLVHVSPRSSADRAAASGAVRGRSSRPGGTGKPWPVGRGFLLGGWVGKREVDQHVFFAHPTLESLFAAHKSPLTIDPKAKSPPHRRKSFRHRRRWRRVDSNHRPRAYESPALASELRRRSGHFNGAYSIT